MDIDCYNSTHPLVSVVMSVYNENESDIRESVNSILNQTYKNIELIIVDDNPENICILKLIEDYEAKHSNIFVIKNEQNIGLALSLNKGIIFSRGCYIARMDADDISDVNRIEREVELLQKKELDMVGSNFDNIDQNGIVIGKRNAMPTRMEDIIRVLPFANFICHPSVLIKRQVIEKLNYYRDFRVSQDYDLWLRMLSSNFKIGITNEVLLHYRTRDNSISSNNMIRRIMYTNFQKQLFKERKKKGIDSFDIKKIKEIDANVERYSKDAKTNKIVKEILDSVAYKKLGKFVKYYLLAFIKRKKFICKWATDLIKYSFAKRRISYSD